MKQESVANMIDGEGCLKALGGLVKFGRELQAGIQKESLDRGPVLGSPPLCIGADVVRIS